jgi:hypothetical protein
VRFSCAVSNTDFFIGAQLAKKSIHTNDKSLEITPTIAAHAGSQYFIKNITNLIA